MQFDQLWREGEESGRVMCIALHPYLIGQPHFADYLDEILEYVCQQKDVWFTTADEIAEFYLENCYDAYMAHAELVRGNRT
jgi:hypothetical protein